MNHDQSYSDESIEGSQRTTGSALSRRALLKHAAFAGGLSVSGTVMSETAGAVEPADCSDIPENSQRASADSGERLIDKELVVKGTGNGVNEYHIETRGNIRLSKDIADQQGKQVFKGTLDEGRSDSYFFIGRVTSVYARGTIMYSVSNP